MADNIVYLNQEDKEDDDFAEELVKMIKDQEIRAMFMTVVPEDLGNTTSFVRCTSPEYMATLIGAVDLMKHDVITSFLDTYDD